MKGAGAPDDRIRSGSIGPRSPEGKNGVRRDMRTRTIGTPEPDEARPDSDSEQPRPVAPARGTPLGNFRNTYYSFPIASDYSGPEVAVYDASCREISKVPQGFHDAVCVQGSGKLASAQTISFAKRDCSCAQICPRSQQKICFEALDPGRFPWGRGAAGRPIHPLRTLAVDTSVIPLGTALYIPAYVGMPLPEGGVHDGCFRAEDRGLKIKGQQIDVFAGSEAVLRSWNSKVPTGQGVDVYADPTCSGR
jgi:3D (Asp-Asp-Asp) domain-containing protein